MSAKSPTPPTRTLRDEFATAALAGGLEQGSTDNVGGNWWHNPDKIAARAYAIADAMLVLRQQTPSVTSTFLAKTQAGKR